MNTTVKTDSSIAYNHIQEDEERPASVDSTKRKKALLRFLAEELIIAVLLALIFYMI